MLDILIPTVVIYGIIGFFVFVHHIDDDHFMKAIARAIFWFPLLVVGASKEFWKLLKE